jgi:hypothetical protein
LLRYRPEFAAATEAILLGDPEGDATPAAG